LNPNVADVAVPFVFHESNGDNFVVRYRFNSGATDVSSAVEWTPSLAMPAWTNSSATHYSPLPGEWAGWRAATIPVTNGTPAGFFRLIISE